MTRRLPSLNALRAFESVSRHLSIVRAAEELNVSAAAVSQLIKQLENYFEMSLFERGKKLTLSTHAQTVAPLITDAFERLTQAVERLRIDNHSSKLIISAPPVFASRWLIPRLDDFQTRHPHIEIHLLTTKRMVDFTREDVDIAIRFGLGNYENLSSERIMPERIVLVASPKLTRNIHQLSDLLNYTLLKDNAGEYDPGIPDWADWLASINLANVPLRIRHFSDVNLVIQAAITGLGIAFVWRSLVITEMQNESLVQILNIALPTQHAYHLVRPKSQHINHKIEAFRNWLQDITQSPPNAPLTPLDH